MTISPVTSRIAKLSHTLANPNSAISTMMIELPTDAGRGYAGYKRGGILEASEKLRKELMSAVVWLFGIPLLKKGGDAICEKFLNIPMGIAFSNSKEGNAAIENSIKYLTSNGKEVLGDFKDASGLKKYFKDGVSKFADQDANQLIKKVKGAKIATSIIAVAANCALMGIVLPLINQKMTQKKLEKMKKENNNNQNQALKIESLDEFKKKTQKNPISFKGGLMGCAEKFVDLVENSTKFRLIAPDVPMIAGRMATSRNKYEALEYLLMDGSGIFLYNFCSPAVQKALRKMTGSLDVDAKAAETISNYSADTLKNAINKLPKDGKQLHLGELFEQTKADEIYKQYTNGDWGHIEAYVKNSTVDKIDESIAKLLTAIKEKAAILGEDGKVINIDADKMKNLIKKTNQKTLAFQLIGWAVAVFGLAIAAPKITFWITKKLTGKNEFTGLAHYDDDKKSKEN